MPRVYFTILLSILWLGLETRSAASRVDPTNCEVPDLIAVVGRGAAGAADPLGTFTVIVRDFNNVPRQNYRVLLDVAGCPDIRIAADQVDPSVTVDCAVHLISMLSDVNGRATFRVIGSATNLGASPGAIGPALNVYAEGVFLETVRVAALDQDGLGGVNGGDLSLFLADYFSGQPFARSDYDGDGALTGIDLSIWLAAFFAAGSAVSGGPLCP